jgi:hypothetical protein
MIGDIHEDHSEEEREQTKANRKPRKKRTKRLGPAPKEIVPLPNPDKRKHEKYKKGDNPIRFPKPFKLSIIGKPNSGKSLMAIHVILAHQAKEPKFDEIHIVHGCNSSKEYDRLEPTSVRANIPSYEEFDPSKRTLLVFDDTDYTMIKPNELTRISELVRFGSSHCNISCIFLTQCFFRMPKVIKDCSDVFIVYKPHDLDELGTIGRRCGLKKEEIHRIFKDHLPNWRDSLLINLIPGAPAKFSKNLFQPLVLNQSDSDDD